MEHAGYAVTRPQRARRAAPLYGASVQAGPRRARRRPRRQSGTPGTVVRVFGILLLTLSAAGAYVHVSNQGRVLAGVHTGATALGGLTASEAQDVLDVAAHPLRSSPAVFALGSREWHPTAAEMGLTIHTDAMASEAAASGRSGFFIAGWVHEGLTGFTHPDIPLRASLNQAQASAFLSAVALEVDREPVNAALSVKNGQVVAGQSASGQKVDLSTTLQRIRLPKALDDVQRVDVAITTVDPSLTEASIGDARQTLARILASPLVLHLDSSTWRLSPAALGAMVDIRKVDSPSGGRVEAVLNESKVAAFVKSIAADVDKPAQDAQLRWAGNGVSVMRQSQDGVKLNQPAAVKAIMSQATTDNRDVALAVTTVKPAVSSDSGALLGIKDLVSSGASKFAGSGPERINNIKVAASRLDGTVIPAGATFSFLTSLGPITKENGYQEGLTILGDETVPGIGGGVCQVSTTVFRAAFFAGLPIVERHQHAYRVGYYEQDGSPVGFDAAVYDPGVDLRFKNDTGNALLLQAQFDQASSTLTFRIYGTSTGRDVKLTPVKANEVKAGPRLPDVPDATLPKGTHKQLEWKADGVDATIRRVVTDGAKTVLSDSFFSRYAPWQEKWAIGTGPAA